MAFRLENGVCLDFDIEQFQGHLDIVNIIKEKFQQLIGFKDILLYKIYIKCVCID